VLSRGSLRAEVTHADAQGAGQAGLGLGGDLLGVLGGSDEGSALGREEPAGLGEGDLAPAAVEQRNAELALQRRRLPGRGPGPGARLPGLRAGSGTSDRTRSPGGGTVGDFLDDVPPGAVIVIDNDGRTDVTVWGGIMTEIAAVRGIAGTVISGVCRDVSACLAQNYPLFSRGRFMRTGKDRVRLAAIGKPVTVSGIEIQPGTLVCADGVVAVPAAEELAEIPHSGHWPMYANPVAMWERIATFIQS